jgi:hypothetical protein
MVWSPEVTKVNSWNEWDPLKHVIVGVATDCHIPPAEPALDAKVPEDSDMRGQWGKRPQDTIDRGNELLDNFADMLTKARHPCRPPDADRFFAAGDHAGFPHRQPVWLHAAARRAADRWQRDSRSHHVVSLPLV